MNRLNVVKITPRGHCHFSSTISSIPTTSISRKRVARDDEGKSGGFRTLVAYRSTDRSLFLYGFAKNDRDNIEKDELVDLKKLSKAFLKNSDAVIKKALDEGKIEDITCENKI
jgi:hypothetical protein